MEMNGINFLGEVGKVLTDNPNFSLDFSQDTKSQVDALAGGAIQLMGATAKIGQRNLTSVLLRAIDKISNDDGIKKIDEDKLIRLIHLSTQFSSEEMQEYISGILAGEYNQPGSFSFKTLEIVRNLGKDDIELFRKFGGLVFGKKDFFKQLYGLNDDSYKNMKQLGIGYDKYLYLVELGLVGDSDSVRDLGSDTPEDFEYSYEISIQGKKIILKKKGMSELAFSSLTTAGIELLPIIGFEENDTLLELVKSEFIRQGFYE